MIQIRKSDVCPYCMRPLEHEEEDLGAERLQITLYCEADEKAIFTRTVTRDPTKDRRSP